MAFVCSIRYYNAKEKNQYENLEKTQKYFNQYYIILYHIQ